MELTSSFNVLLHQFTPVFTTPTFQTFLQIVTGWIVSHRHRYITDIIFSGGNVGNGHWSRFRRYFSHSAWDLDTLSSLLARIVVRVFCPGAIILWAVDDTLCRKRGLTLYGAGMHYDPSFPVEPNPWSVGDTIGWCCVWWSLDLFGQLPKSLLCPSPFDCIAIAKDSPKEKRNPRPANPRSSNPTPSSHSSRIGPGTDRSGRLMVSQR